MITGAHIVVYSKDAEKDRSFFQNVLGLASVDAGDGWLIFGMPKGELAIHPADEDNVHELFLTCDSISETLKHLKAMKVKCGPQRDMSWGKLVMITLPGGGELGIYEPKHRQIDSDTAQLRGSTSI